MIIVVLFFTGKSKGEGIWCLGTPVGDPDCCPLLFKTTLFGRFSGMYIFFLPLPRQNSLPYLPSPSTSILHKLS